MKAILIAAAALLPAWSAASAQDADDLRVRVGLGAQLQPDFIGSDGTELAPLGRLNIAHGTDPFKFNAPDYSPGLPLVRSGGFSFGPAANIASGRKNSDLDVPVGKVKTTIEAGAFASYQVSESLYLRAEALKGLGGHKGIVGQVGADQVWRDGDK
jgi:outer membrane protein